MKLFEIFDDMCECRCEMVFEDARSPTDEEYNFAAAKLRELDPTAKLGSIGVYAGTGDIYIETLDGKEFVIWASSGEMEPVYEGMVNEAAIRQFKRVGQEIKRKYRCLSGPKAGKLVATPGACATRKDPKKVRHGRKVMRSKKRTISRKSQISKRKQLSKMVTKMNKRLAGKI